MHQVKTSSTGAGHKSIFGHPEDSVEFFVILLNCIRLVLHRVLPGLINVWLQRHSPIYFHTVRLNPYLLFKGSKWEMRVNLDSAGSWLLAAKQYNNLLLFRLHLDIIYFHFFIIYSLRINNL